MNVQTTSKVPSVALEKCLTGIRGLDDITQGGLPRGRPTLVCGGPGSGKTLLAMEFLVRGARQFGEPGVFMAFEETSDELSVNVDSLGFDVPQLLADKTLVLEYVSVERSEIEETGEYDLEGLFVRLGWLVDQVGAKRVAIDSLEALFAGFENEAIVRAELRRLFRWLKERRLTAVITAEQGENSLTRHGLEEYVSDCVIFLDHRLENQVATRRLRIVKYRGSAHGTNEYPTMIDQHGLSVLPISSINLDYEVSSKRVSTGISGLDAMMGGLGLFRGSSVLISGTAGTGKSSMAAAFSEAACKRGEHCLYLAFEESPEQIMRNMRSIGIDLRPWEQKGLLTFHAARSTLFGLEQHLVSIYRLVEDHAPAVVVVDPVSNLDAVGSTSEVTAMLARLIDFLKGRGITAVFTSLTRGGGPEENSGANISSLMDTWILLRQVEALGDRRRVLYILKSRGMAHSSRVAGFQLSDDGIYLAAEGDGAHS
jgi:circadian clock protein KaiC